MIKHRSVIILGGGASGMAAAVSAASEGADVLIIEGNGKLGRKLYATGNGHCNFSNIHCSADDYNDSADGFVEAVLRRFNPEDCLHFFEGEGLLSRVDEAGRCYPHSGQAASLVEVLERSLARRGVLVETEDKAVRVGRNEGGIGFFVICESGRKYEAGALIIACGGKAGHRFGSTGDGFGFAKTFGHTIAETRPALVAVRAAPHAEEMVSGLKGVRARGILTLYRDDQSLRTEPGEIQFNGTGISGICMFDLSRYMETARRRGSSARKMMVIDVHSAQKHEIAHRYEVSVDFVPELTAEELELLTERFSEQAGGDDPMYRALCGIVDKKVARTVTRLADGSDYEKAASLLKDYRVEIASTGGWDDAQVTRGGVRREEIDPATLGSRLAEGLYFCGEVIDVDGRCGGFNLQWAWASGIVAGRLL